MMICYYLVVLQLSITLEDPRNATNSAVLVESADISQGFSNKVDQDGATVYEHQANVSYFSFSISCVSFCLHKMM